MSKIRFARLSFQKTLEDYYDDVDVLERRKNLLSEVIAFSTDLNSLLKGTNSHNKTHKGDWYFGDVHEGETIISARLGKAKEDIRHLPNDEIEGFVSQRDEDTDLAFFVIDLSQSVMAYESVRNIGKKAPYRILQNAFNSYYEGAEELSISPLVDKQEVREEIASISYIKKISFANLRPSNPDHTSTSKPMDEFLRDTDIDRLHMRGISDERKNDSDGIDMEGEPFLDGGLNLAQEGYGSATIEGKTETGEEKEVKTGDIPIKSETELGESDKVNRKRLLEEIRNALDELDE